MGTRTVKMCDVTGQEVADDTKPDRLTWQGTTYRLYLSDEGRERLVDFLEPILEGADEDTGYTATVKQAADAGGATRKRKTPEQAAADKKRAADRSAQLEAIRAWGNENNFPNKGKGRLPDGLKEAWAKATGEALID